MATLQTDFEIINAEQVIDEHFYINPDYIQFYYNNRDLCFDPFTLKQGETLDFSANVSISKWPGTNAKNLGRLFLMRNGTERVAQNWFSTYGRWSSPSGSLIYREKLAADASYKLCFTYQDKIDQNPVFSPGMFQWGYKVLGSGHNISTHSFDTNAMKLTGGDPLWHV